MGMATAPPLGAMDAATTTRLHACGFDLDPTAARPAARVVLRPEDDSDRLPAILADALADDGGDADGPVSIVVVPASLPIRPGPVTVLSPPGSSSYEVYVGAAIAAGTDRRVEHLNGRGTAGSAVHSGIAGRFVARAAAPSWHETAQAHPERALALLSARPAAIVVPAVEGLDAARIVAQHPDADIVVLADRAGLRRGPAVAAQVGAMVELAFGIGAPASTEDAARARRSPVAAPIDPAPDLPQIRASDVVHARLTSRALELTNRTRQHLRVAVALGEAAHAATARAEFVMLLLPGASVDEPIHDVPGLEGLTPPVAVMRHWSHESEEVYEGGDLRMVRLTVTVTDAAGSARGTREYRPGNGVDFLVTARDLADQLGRPVARSVLPEPVAHAASAATPKDILGAFEAALRIGRDALAARHE